MTADNPTIDEAMEALEKRRDSGNLNAYYYGFAPTGDADIDLILAAVASAGKGYHHTQDWRDDNYGPSCAEKIQEAADRAAKVKQMSVNCSHPTARYSAEHDNFYCTTCNQGMGTEFYAKHINVARAAEAARRYTSPESDTSQRDDDNA